MPTTISLPGLSSFRFNTHDDRDDVFISRQISERRMWEPLETQVVCRLLPFFRIFIDLGANIGWYTAIAQRLLGARADIFAFEPEPRNFALLKRNASRWWPWPRTTLVQAAVGDRIGTLDLYLSASNQGDHRGYASEAGRSCLTVPVTTLDAFFADKPLHPLLLKCDTQGCEPRILRGAQRALSANLESSVLILEFWPQGIASSGEDIDAFIGELAMLPHKPFIIDNFEMKLRPLDWDTLATRCAGDLAPSTGWFLDLLLLPMAQKSGPGGAVLDLIA